MSAFLSCFLHDGVFHTVILWQFAYYFIVSCIYNLKSFPWELGFLGGFTFFFFFFGENVDLLINYSSAF